MKELKVGQVWQYKTREGEENSRIYIIQIDEHPRFGQVFHIHIDNLSVRNPEFTGGIQNVVPHSAVNENALNQSITELDNIITELPDVSIGYRIWADSIHSGESTVFSIEIKQLVQMIEDSVAF